MKDVAVIGGGISGLGVGLAAILKGKSCVIIEQGEICGVTSHNSLRIIHGGFRYLQTLNLARMMRSLRDQNFVLQEFKSSVSALPCIMPLNSYGLKSRMPVKIASILYGAAMNISGSALPKPTVEGGEIGVKIPLLAKSTKHGALIWWDGLMKDPESLSNQLGANLLEQGCEIRTQVGASKVIRKSGSFEVELSTGEIVVAKNVVNTAGPMSYSVKPPEGFVRNQISWCRGINITLNLQLEKEYGIGIESKTGRLFFIVPRGKNSCIGTWYAPVENDLEGEIKNFLSELNEVLQRMTDRQIQAFRRSDIIAIDSGVLPTHTALELLGSEKIQSDRGYIEVTSTKYTTFRSQGERVLSALYAT